MKKIGTVMLCASLLLSGNLTGNRTRTRLGLADPCGEAFLQKGESGTAVLTDWSDVLPAGKLYAKTCALMDSETGRLLYGKDQAVPRANASTTKILTCILALESGKTDELAEVSARAAGQPRVRLGMKAGEKYRIRDLLYCLMLESFNDCAVAMAEAVSGSVEAFAGEMNRKAGRIGCKDSLFITPNGLDDRNRTGFHHTTAEDLCRIMAYCVKESPKRADFLAITGKKSYQFKDPQGKSHSLTNHNRLLWELPGVISGKTGFTADAGYCYVCAYEREGRSFTAAFLGCGWPNNRNWKWRDARRLLDFGVKHYARKAMLEKPKLHPVEVQGCLSGRERLLEWGKPLCFTPELDWEENTEKNSDDKSAEENAKPQNSPCMGLISERDRVEGRISFRELETPVRKGQAIGSYVICLNGQPVKRIAVRADRGIREWTVILLFRAVVRDFLRCE